MKYLIEFTHTEESIYTAEIEAETKEEALDVFHDGPFDHLIDDEPSEVNGIDVSVNHIGRA